MPDTHNYNCMPGFRSIISFTVLGAMSKMEMCTVFVTLKIKKECVEDFLKVIETDMIESRKEAGCLRFDVLRQDDPKPGDGEGVEM
jgi:hypothetical protein